MRCEAGLVAKSVGALDVRIIVFNEREERASRPLIDGSYGDDFVQVWRRARQIAAINIADAASVDTDPHNPLPDMERHHAAPMSASRTDGVSLMGFMRHAPLQLGASARA